MTVQASCCCGRCSDECHLVWPPSTAKCGACEGGNQATVAGFSMQWDPQQYLCTETRGGCYSTLTQPNVYDCAGVLQGQNVPWVVDGYEGVKYRQFRSRATLYYYWQAWNAQYFNPTFGQLWGEALYQYPVVSFTHPTVVFERFYQTSPQVQCNHRVKTYTGGDAGSGEFVATYTHCTTFTNWPDAMQRWIADEVCRYSVIVYARNVYYQKAGWSFGTGPNVVCAPAGWTPPPAPNQFTRTLLGQTEAWYYRKLPAPGTSGVDNYCFNRGQYQLGYSEFTYAGGSLTDTEFPLQIDPLDPTPPTPLADPSPGVLAGNPGQVDRWDVLWPLGIELL